MTEYPPPSIQVAGGGGDGRGGLWSYSTATSVFAPKQPKTPPALPAVKVTGANIAKVAQEILTRSDADVAVATKISDALTKGKVLTISGRYHRHTEVHEGQWLVREVVHGVTKYRRPTDEERALYDLVDDDA